MSYHTKRFLAQALDPVHIGTGGERLGRVDLSVVREPVNRVPKIPGTSLSGALKFFADLKLRDMGVKNGMCASTTGSKREDHNHAECPICAPFGYTPQSTGGKTTVQASAQGILQFTDALLLAYPINTLIGPVWVTTNPRLCTILEDSDETDHIGETYLLPEGSAVISPLDNNGKLNLGWILLEKGEGICPSVEQIKTVGINEKYAGWFLVISEWLFSHLVNDNMEIRTSVVIDPETGAASSKGLFTYEAVARGAFFVFQLIENDYKDAWPNVEWKDKEGAADKPQSAMEMVEQYAFDGIAAVGLGGMTTRGFGRLRIQSLNI